MYFSHQSDLVHVSSPFRSKTLTTIKIKWLLRHLFQYKTESKSKLSYSINNFPTSFPFFSKTPLSFRSPFISLHH